MSDDLRARIDQAISRVPAARAADEVLAEIGREHVIVDRERWGRVLAYAVANRDMQALIVNFCDDRELWNATAERGQAAEAALQPGDLEG